MVRGFSFEGRPDESLCQWAEGANRAKGRNEELRLALYKIGFWQGLYSDPRIYLLCLDEASGRESPSQAMHLAGLMLYEVV
jgi:hypothetical protein